jgi:hypothetical protein
MIFTLETLAAKHGDALLLHYGDDDDPQLIVIDGGPGGVYSRTLRPRLNAIRATRVDDQDDPLFIRMVMVSHIDDDHINGLLSMFRQLIREDEDGDPASYDVTTLWHNSFDDVVGQQSDTQLAALADTARAAAAGDPLPAGPHLSRHGGAVVASVKQGRTLREQARVLGLNVNEGFGGGLVQVPNDEIVPDVDFDGGLSLEVIGPIGRRVEELQVEWDRQLQQHGLARTAAFLDSSVFNLASITVIAKARAGGGDREFLLTGDARGDDILTGLSLADRLDSGSCHFDVLKIPHHGSDRNVSTDFFRQVTADFYVVSGDGRHGNPEPALFEMIAAARSDRDFEIQLTYPPSDRVQEVLDTIASRGAALNIRVRPITASSLTVEFGTPITF